MKTRADAWRRCPPLLFLIPLLLGLLVSASAHSGKLSDIEYVIHVSVDGVNATRLTSYLGTYGGTTFSNWKRFIDEGATTLNARTAYAWTDTLPNHTSQLTAMPVDPPSGYPDSSAHFYTDNGEPPPYPFTIHSNHPTSSIYISSAWDVAHDYGLSTSHFSSKTKFVIYEQTWEDGGGPDAAPGVAGDNGTDKVDYTSITISSNHFGNGLYDSWDMHQDFLTRMAAGPYDYAFIHYVDPDKGGHADGWNSTLYRETLEQVDGYLADVFNLVETDATLMDKTVIILTTDHGGGDSSGTSTAHHSASASHNYTVPFFLWGPGVEAGADLYTLNTGVRADPGSGRPDFNVSPQPVRNAGAGNLALQLLGLPAIPGSWSNASQDLVLGSCVVDADCDDTNACTDDVCDQGECTNTNNTDPCDDADACTVGDVCGGGVCTSGGSLDCNDSNVCTNDSCDTVLGCEYADNTDPCDDANACTVGDICGGGVCTSGGPRDCNDSNVCTNDSCDMGTGCVNANNTDPCDDANACTVGDICGGGVCTSSGPRDCNDSNVCTNDSCLPATGCDYVNNTAPCPDGDLCNGDEVCDGAGSCGAGTPPDCDDINICTDDSCDTGLGCVHWYNTDPCDDANACTVDDTCGGGTCQGGGPLDCDDSNECTDQLCSPLLGCQYFNNSRPCDDGNACTDGCVCSGGVCTSGDPLGCDDGNLCTADSCDSVSGCSHEYIEDCVGGPVPTTPEWGLPLLAGLLLAAGALLVRERRRTAA